MSRSSSAEQRGRAGILAPGWRSALAAGLRFRPLAALLALLLALHALGSLPLSPVARLDRALYDLQVRLTAPRGPDPRIVWVDVDERSLGRHGRWPWPRALLARLLERLVDDGGAALVGLDIVLAEADHSSGLAALDRLVAGLDAQPAPLAADPAVRAALAQLRPALDDDAHLAAALRRLPVVLGFHLSNDPGAGEHGVLPPPLLPAAALAGHAEALPAWRGQGGNLPALQQAAQWGAGHLNGHFDTDGVLRRVPLLVRHDGAVHGSLALVMARWLLGGPGAPAQLGLLPAEPPLQAVRLAGAAGTRSVVVDAEAQALVPWRSGADSFERLPATDVLEGRLPPGALRGKVVLVGVSAPGLLDQRSTPVDGALPGTLVHANLLSGLLDDRLPGEPRAARWAEAATVLACAALLAVLLPRLGMAGALALAGGLLLLVAAGHALAWVGWQRTGPAGAVVLLVPLLLALDLLLAYRRAASARQRLKRLFGQYVPPELVEEMSRQPERHTMNSRSAELSVLFADVRGFTGLAERMPPAELSAMMNLLFSRLTDIVRAHRGTLDKYIGDCVMAFWGAPLDDPQHAAHAVDAALAMRAALPALQDELAARGWPRLDLSIGIDTGPVVVGDMGSRHRLAYTVLGDTVNRAARLQALAGSADLGLVVGDATRAALGDRLCLPLGEVQLRGRGGTLAVWQPLPARAGEQPALAQRVALWTRWHQARADGRTDEAQRLLADLEAAQPGDPVCAWQRGRTGT